MKKYSRVCARIDLDAVEYNLDMMKQNIKEETKMIGVIKTDGYGHGAVQIARYVMEEKDYIWGYAVATLDEAVLLKKNQVKKPVLVLGCIFPDQRDIMIEQEVRMTCYTLEMAEDISKRAQKLNQKAYIHIKLDTGMSRIGFKSDAESIEATVQGIVMINSLLKNIRIDGIFTHFACADCEDDHMTFKQLKRFDNVIDRLEKNDVHIPIKHCANSAAIIKYPGMSMNMARAGIIIYGLYPSDEVDREVIKLEPVMRLKSHVIYVKTVEPGTTVGYGATYVCQRPTKIATVSIGYGDGYPRALSNKGRVLIGSQSWPIIGRICMDQLMVDVTDADYDIKQGDEVVLVGSQGSESIPVEEVASINNSFNYEFVCDINRRVPRVYYRDGEVVDIVNYLR